MRDRIPPVSIPEDTSKGRSVARGAPRRQRIAADVLLKDGSGARDTVKRLQGRRSPVVDATPNEDPSSPVSRPPGTLVLLHLGLPEFWHFMPKVHTLRR